MKKKENSFDIKNIMVSAVSGFTTQVLLNKSMQIPFVAVRPDLATAIMEGVGVAFTFFGSNNDTSKAIGYSIIGASSSQFTTKFPALNGVSSMYPQNGVSTMRPQNGALEDEFRNANISMNEAITQLKDIAGSTDEAYQAYEL